MSKQIQSRLPLNYINVRRIIGILAMSLPILIFLAEKIILQKDLQPSISAYYYTEMGWFFILTLCCIGFFLFFYQGFDNIDKWLARLAGLAAFSTALFPTEPPYQNICASPIAAFLPPGQENLTVGSWICNLTSTIHLLSASTMFLTVAYFSFSRFTLDEPASNEKQIRKNIYKICGIVIFGAILAIGISFSPLTSKIQEPLKSMLPYVTYWGEFIALFAFGVTWAVKGEMLWKDSVPSNNSRDFNKLQSLQYQGYKSGLSFYVLLVAIWFTSLLFAARVPPFNLFEEGKGETAVSATAEMSGTENANAPEGETRSIGFYKKDAQNILNGILFILVVVVIYFILDNQVLSLFWPLVRRNFRADLGDDTTGEKEALWTLFTNQATEMEVQSRFSINPKAETAIAPPTTLTPESSYLKAFFELLGWIFPRLGYSLRLNKISSKSSGTGLSLAVVKNDKKDSIAEKIFWAKEFGINELIDGKNEDLGKDLETQKYLMIPAFFWFTDIVDRMDGFEPNEHAWESMAYYHLGNLLWHSDPKKGISFYINSINFDQKNWHAYASLGRIWIEQSQWQSNKKFAIEDLLLANSYLETAIHGLNKPNLQDKVYFGALYNQVVALNYLLALDWDKPGFGLEKVILEAYKVKATILLKLLHIQEEQIQAKQRGFFVRQRGEKKEEQVNTEDPKDQCEKLSTKIKSGIFNGEKDSEKQSRKKVSEFELKNDSTAGYLIQLLPALEFAIQGLELQKKGYSFKKAKESVEQLVELPGFDKPINMDSPIDTDKKPRRHFIRSHYRIQYNAACFYSQLATLASKKEEKSFFADLALDHLVMALSAGGGLVKFAQQDSDLAVVREQPRYKEIIGNETGINTKKPAKKKKVTRG